MFIFDVDFLYIVLINTCMVPFLSMGDYSFNPLSYTAQDPEN